MSSSALLLAAAAPSSRLPLCVVHVDERDALVRVTVSGVVCVPVPALPSDSGRMSPSPLRLPNLRTLLLLLVQCRRLASPSRGCPTLLCPRALVSAPFVPRHPATPQRSLHIPSPSHPTPLCLPSFSAVLLHTLGPPPRLRSSTSPTHSTSLRHPGPCAGRRIRALPVQSRTAQRAPGPALPSPSPPPPLLPANAQGAVPRPRRSALLLRRPHSSPCTPTESPSRIASAAAGPHRLRLRHPVPGRRHVCPRSPSLRLPPPLARSDSPHRMRKLAPKPARRRGRYVRLMRYGSRCAPELGPGPQPGRAKPTVRTHPFLSSAVPTRGRSAPFPAPPCCSDGANSGTVVRERYARGVVAGLCVEEEAHRAQDGKG